MSTLLALHGRLLRSEDRIIECKFGSQLMTRTLGGAFVPHSKLPTLAIIRLSDAKGGGTTVALEVREAVGFGSKMGMVQKLRAALDQLAEEIMQAVQGVKAEADVKGLVEAPTARAADAPPKGPLTELQTAIRALKELDSGSTEGNSDAEAVLRKAEEIRGQIEGLVRAIGDRDLASIWGYYHEALSGRLPIRPAAVLDTLQIRALTI